MRLRGILAAAALLALAGAACSPPKALRNLVGGGEEASGADLVPPQPPSPPAAVLFGVVVTTNSEGWGVVLEHSTRAGALVVDIIPETPADKAGVGRGDLITRIDKREIRNNEGVTVSFRSTEDRFHRITLIRANGQARTVEAVLTASGDFSLPDYLRARLVEDPDAVRTYLVAQNTQDASEALTLLEPLLAELPEFAPALALQARRLLEQAITSTIEEEEVPSEALAGMRNAITRAVNLDPESSDNRVLHARVLLFMDESDEAHRSALRAVSLDASSPEAQHMLGLVLIARGDPERSLVPLRRAVSLNPYDLDYYVWLARGYADAGQTKRAEITIESAKAIVEDPLLEAQLDQVLEEER